MSYSVRYRIDQRSIPEPARSEIQHTMQQVAEVVGSVPASSPFWASMNDSLLQIDVKGWRVVYRIDPAHHEIRVVEAQPIR